jgi:hypothetical protein
MRDVNEPVRVAYAAALSAIPGVLTYYQILPNNLNPDNYIVFRSINNNDASTKSNAGIIMTITVEIHTKNNIMNPGLTADSIADQIFELVYIDKQTNLTLSRGQILYTQIATDQTVDFVQRNQFGYQSRFITFRHYINVDSVGESGGGSMTSVGQIFRLEYTGVGGEDSFSDSQLINKSILIVFKDGVEFSQILTAGTPTNKQVVYTASTGTLTFPMAIEPNEEIAVVYQLSNPFQTMVFGYTATGGEESFTDPTIENKAVYGIMRDGVSASKILSTGTPVDKEAKYETSTGTVYFGVALEPGEQIKILYQLN